MSVCFPDQNTWNALCVNELSFCLKAIIVCKFRKSAPNNGNDLVVNIKIGQDIDLCTDNATICYYIKLLIDCNYF